MRHPGRRQRRRRAAQHRPRRRDRAARRRSRPGPLRPGDATRCSTIRRRPRRWAQAAAVRARRFTWSFTAARLRRLYADLAGRPATRSSGGVLVIDGSAGPASTEVERTVMTTCTTTALAALERRIDGWLASIAASASVPVESIERAEGDVRRWYVRLRGEDKEFTTVWLTLGQRTLRYETYVMPAPGGERRRAVRAPAAAQREAGRRPLLDRHRGRRVPARRAAGRARWPRPSSIGASARSTPRSSSASRRCCASASPPASRSHAPAGGTGGRGSAVPMTPRRDEGRCQPPDGTSPVGAARKPPGASQRRQTRALIDVRKESRPKNSGVIHAPSSMLRCRGGSHGVGEGGSHCPLLERRQARRPSSRPAT